MDWRSAYGFTALLTLGLLSDPLPSFAACTRAASADTLHTFDNDPAGFMRARSGQANLGEQVVSVASAALNTRDPLFGKSLGLALGSASAAQGRAVGAALARVGSLCSDPLDPSDRNDKAFIATEIAPNLATNEAANAAYGLALDEEQTASIGGGGDGGGGSTGSGGALGSPSGGDTASAPEQTADATRSAGPAEVGVSGGGGSSGGGNGSSPSYLSITPTTGTVLTGANSVSAN